MFAKIASALFASVALAGAFAQTYGTLDLSWGGANTGYVKTSILSPTNTSSQDIGRAIAVQLDGKIVVAGVCYNGSAYSLCVVRYNANGSLDSSYGTSGKTTLSIAGNNGVYPATAIALTPTGGALIATGCANASSVRQFCVARFDARGAVDTGFGNNGVVTTSLATSNNYPSSIGYQSDGRLLIGGICGNQICAIAYLQDGSAIDTAFANNGLLLNGFTGTFNRETYAMAIDPNDRVLLGGSCFISSQPVFCVSRFTSSGQADASFTNGVVAALPGSQDYAYAMTVQSDGKILLTGQAFNTVNSSTAFDFATVRYNADGTLDTGFGTNGYVVTRIADSYSEARSIVEQADGKIVVAGHCYDFSPAGRRFCLVAYNANGSLDTSFNGTGFSKLILGPQSSFAVDESFAAAIGRDGKLYAAGRCRYASGSSQYDFCVARYYGSPTGGLACNVDLDSSGIVLAVSDSLLHARTVSGLYKNPFAGFIMVSGLGVPFFVDAWTPIYKKLLRTSIDYDGDGTETATDSVIHARIAFGFTGTSVTTGLSFAPQAARTTWTKLRAHFINRCGYSLP